MPLTSVQRKAGVVTQDLLESYFDRLWPICRSITGPGFRQSLDILSELMPVDRLNFQTGQKVFDWTVPQEWVPRDAFFVDAKGVKHADFKQNNLHLLGYSVPYRGKLSLAKLRSHLFTVPEQPDAVPYRTSYYQKNWGFCISYNELKDLKEDTYEIFIDSELKDGALQIGETVLAGETPDEILFTTYLCHPSLANNELSGPLVMTALYQKIAALPRRRLTYRFAVMPETIGAICYLSERGDHLKKFMRAGYLLTCLGDRGNFTYKKTRDASTLTDRAASVVLRDRGPHEILSFDPGNGSDERQFCSPGFNLPFGSLMRSMYGRYPEYHTSLDDKSLISIDSMMESAELCFEIVQALENNLTWRNSVMHCEPQLGERGLYPTLGSQVTLEQRVKAMMWLLNLADGRHDLLSIAERSHQKLQTLTELATVLSKSGLLITVPPESSK